MKTLTFTGEKLRADDNSVKYRLKTHGVSAAAHRNEQKQASHFSLTAVDLVS